MIYNYSNSKIFKIYNHVLVVPFMTGSEIKWSILHYQSRKVFPIVYLKVCNAVL